ncbi:unnamed protein product, partial [Sphacelaria rigidula]
MPLAPEAREIFTIVTTDVFCTPTRVTQVVLNATAYFQGVLTDILRGLNWADGVFYFADTEETLLAWLDKILGRLESVGLFQMRRPPTTSELMRFLQALNWLRTSLPRTAEVVVPLRVFLEQLMVGASRRTKRVARNRIIPEDAWTEDHVRAWPVLLYHPRPGCVVLMFPDASDFHWGSFLRQVPVAEFSSSQLRWATVDKEGFAIVNT